MCTQVDMVCPAGSTKDDNNPCKPVRACRCASLIACSFTHHSTHSTPLPLPCTLIAADCYEPCSVYNGVGGVGVTYVTSTQNDDHCIPGVAGGLGEHTLLLPKGATD